MHKQKQSYRTQALESPQGKMENWTENQDMSKKDTKERRKGQSYVMHYMNPPRKRKSGKDLNKCSSRLWPSCAAEVNCVRQHSSEHWSRYKCLYCCFTKIRALARGLKKANVAGWNWPELKLTFELNPRTNDSTKTGFQAFAWTLGGFGKSEKAQCLSPLVPMSLNKTCIVAGKNTGIDMKLRD